jgi:hypothetical protein
VLSRKRIQRLLGVSSMTLFWRGGRAASTFGNGPGGYSGDIAVVRSREQATPKLSLKCSSLVRGPAPCFNSSNALDS